MKIPCAPSAAQAGTGLEVFPLASYAMKRMCWGLQGRRFASPLFFGMACNSHTTLLVPTAASLGVCPGLVAARERLVPPVPH